MSDSAICCFPATLKTPLAKLRINYADETVCSAAKISNFNERFTTVLLKEYTSENTKLKNDINFL